MPRPPGWTGALPHEDRAPLVRRRIRQMAERIDVLTEPFVGEFQTGH
jgi:hypothetical protein